MKIGPKYKIAKRLGAGIFEKTQTQKFALSEGRQKKFRSTPKTDYGRQFLEKQKIRFTYGVTERQLRNYIRETIASGKPGPETLFQLLERRLDSTVHRLGLAPSQRAARQMVSHGHIMVNGKRITVPSYRTTAGETIQIRTGSKTATPFVNLSERLKDHMNPSWLVFDAEKGEGSVKSEPKLTGVTLHFELAPVLEFYSR